MQQTAPWEWFKWWNRLSWHRPWCDLFAREAWLFSKAGGGLLTKIRSTRIVFSKAQCARNTYIIVIQRGINKLYSQNPHHNMYWLGEYGKTWREARARSVGYIHSYECIHFIYLPIYFSRHKDYVVFQLTDMSEEGSKEYPFFHSRQSR